jgi:alkanesulfonate monooxygenase SsuD/methylene tetrahydromethanopterin reductase-like flavin-dependent oxidoreductase (luciferase family)
MLDESLEILTAAWSGEPVHHRGEHYTVAGMRFLPQLVEIPEVPVSVDQVRGVIRDGPATPRAPAPTADG